MKHSTNRLVISLVPTYSRILNAITVIFLSSAFIVLYKENGFVPILAIAISLSLLFLCYEDRWIFDTEKNQIIFKNGLFFLAKIKKIPFSDIESLSCMKFQKGFKKTDFTRIVVIEKNGTETVIASLATEKHSTLVKQAHQLEIFFDNK
ncbi:MAG TPA: hypothetical protein VJ861_05210 [Treponemataceae bacterium]|nr:hypothetical protein [Treponemataceae bacterium]